jgi:uncharacterized membrane protein (DUF4010 family)
MSHLPLPLKLLLAIFLGAVIGLERESPHEKSISQAEIDIGRLGGVRTFSLISLLGAVAGLLALAGNFPLFLTITIAFFTLIGISYVISSLLVKSAGLTTELSALFVFLIGFFITTEIFPAQLVVALAVVLALILSLKEKTKTFVLGIRRAEIDAFISFAIVALVVLPFLPQKSYFLTDIPAVKTMLGAYKIQLGALGKLEIINPFKLWFIVALITGIDVAGYILGKLAGQKKGLLLTSSVGGFISSTSTTQSLAQQSKKGGRIDQLAAAAIFANLTSFLQVFMLVAPLNSDWLVAITPTLLLIIFSALAAGLFYLLKKKRGEKEEEVEATRKKIAEEKIFSLGPAVRFALVLVAIRTITKTALAFFGQAGFLFTSVIASFSGIDAIVINLAELAGGPITFKAALLTLVCVNATNLLSKAGYSFFQGKREFALKFLVAMLAVIVSSAVGYFLI